MKELNLYPLNGLMGELRKTEFIHGHNTALVPGGKESLKNANRLFWEKHLKKIKLESLINLASDRFCYSPCETPQFRAVLDNPELFLKQMEQALNRLDRPVLSEQKFFTAMESLTILCNMYSDFLYKPFRLTIDQGFLLNETDTRVLVKECLSPVTNPYYKFIIKNLWPIIETIQPGIIWMLGPPRFSTLAMVMLAKKKIPKVHICAVDYPGEYYSLNKIKKYLKTNSLLFSIIDSVILYDNDDTQKKLIEAIDNHASLNVVPNLLYIDRTRDTIKETQTQICPQKNVCLVSQPFEPLQQKEGAKKKDYSFEVLVLKLWPENACYWNKCTFCGINEKYHTGSISRQYENINQKVNFIERKAKEGYRFFWLVDEAVPPDVLKIFADRLIKQNINIHWQVRSRIDDGFSQEVCDSLAKAGLKEIRFGLESASYRILKLMNKFPENFDLSIVENVVKRFHQNGISVHLCLILDFPTETYPERKETFDFLRYLKNKYPTLTFNLNRFMLDITSKVFAHYEDFGITTIQWPCHAKYFLGNIISWDSTSDNYSRKNIDAQRNGFMRETLYPWMPETPMTPPFNFYVQYENQSMTLLWKTKISSHQTKGKIALSQKTKIKKSDNLVHSKTNRKKGTEYLLRIYNWDTHFFLECDEKCLHLYNIFTNPLSVQQGLELFHTQFFRDSLTQKQVFEQYFPQLEKAYANGMVKICEE